MSCTGRQTREQGCLVPAWQFYGPHTQSAAVLREGEGVAVAVLLYRHVPIDTLELDDARAEVVKVVNGKPWVAN